MIAGFQTGAAASGPRNPPVEASGDALLTSFVIENWGSSGDSNTYRLFGMPFAPGDMPDGSYPVIKRSGVEVASGFGQVVPWHDGSGMQLCWMAFRDTDIVNGSPRTYDLYRRTGTPPAPSTTKTLSDALALVDPQIAFSSVTHTNGGTATHGSGAMLAKLSVAAAVSTRVTHVISSDVLDRWHAWDSAYDGADGSGSADATLVVEWLVDIYKDAGGSIVRIDCVGAPLQGRAKAATKRRLNYTATFKDGSTTIATYSSLQHCYYQWWGTYETAASNQTGRMRTLYGTRDTLHYKPNRSYWLSTGLMPQVGLVTTLTAYASATYAPLSMINHRDGDADGTGEWIGRPIISGTDVVAFNRADVDAMRTARANAHAVMACGVHLRSDANRTRPGEGSADEANEPFVFAFNDHNGAGSTTAWTADGMPAGQATFSGITSAAGNVGNFPVGSNDSSHCSNYAYFTILMEGDYLLMRASWDHAVSRVWRQNQFDNEFGHQSPVPGSAWSPRVSAFSIPWDFKWSALYPTDYSAQERSMLAWGVMASAFATVPANAPAHGYIRGLMLHQAKAWARCLSLYTPTSHLANGQLFSNSVFTAVRAEGACSPWMQNLSGAAIAFAAMLTRHADTAALADHIAKYAYNLIKTNLACSTMYRGISTPEGRFWNTDNEYLDTVLWQHDVPVMTVADHTTDVVTITTGIPIQNGDSLIVGRLSYGSGSADDTPLTGLTLAAEYWIGNVSGDTCKLYHDQALTNVVNVTQNGDQIVYVRLRNAHPGGSLNGDGATWAFAAICMMHLAQQRYRGAHPSLITDALLDQFADALDATTGGPDEAGVRHLYFRRPGSPV